MPIFAYKFWFFIQIVPIINEVNNSVFLLHTTCIKVNWDSQ